MLNTITGERGDYQPALEQVRFGQAEPYCVRWETGEEPEPEPEPGNFVSPVTARLAAWVWLKRAERVLLRNTDGEPMVLIDAAVTVDGDVAEQLTPLELTGEHECGRHARPSGTHGLSRVSGIGGSGRARSSPRNAADGQSTPPGSVPNSVSNL
jgi:hypothetical protein